MIGIILPSYYTNPQNNDFEKGDSNNDKIPARYSDNLNLGYAGIYTWGDISIIDKNSKFKIKQLIEDTFWRKDHQPDKINNSRLQLEYNLIF